MSLRDALKTLHTALGDAHNGYVEARRNTRDADLVSLFREMSALHERHRRELHGALTSIGEFPDARGAFMPAVLRTLIGARAAVMGIDDNVLPSFARGEERLVAQYDQAIGAGSDAPAIIDLLNRQKRELLAMIPQMRARSRA